MSKKRYIFTIDDDCFVANKPTGERINALQQHIRNLLTPSTPHFFNTLYDPYVEGSDFVRGYPFSMRDGVPTAISHGLCKSRYACVTTCALVQQPRSKSAVAVYSRPGTASLHAATPGQHALQCLHESG